MKVCVVGSGGREHALAVALGRTAEVVVTPGNAGMAALGVACVPGPPGSVEADLYVIGPEAPLVDGLADELRAAGRLVFGPGADGARLEGSKAWMKEILTVAGVPTAAYGTFDALQPAVEFLRSRPGPWVVKTDGLAAGKGVLVTDDLAAAEADVAAKLSGEAFGAAGSRVVIEEALAGPELSVMAVCDGQRAVALAPAQDFKRADDGDAGPNTGGMGAYSPVPGAGAEVVEMVMAQAVYPTLAALRDRGIDYRGVLYAGIMLTDDGPRVLEFNVRFGDPETQVVLPRWEGDVAAVLAAAAAGRLDQVPAPAFSPRACACVVLAAPGYPESPRPGDRIDGLATVAAVAGIELYCAGVAAGEAAGEAAEVAADHLVTAGGRVLAISSSGPTLEAARRQVYGAIPLVSWPGMKYRTDIAAAAAAHALVNDKTEVHVPMKVAVLMGSANDQPKMAPAVEMLASFGVEVTEHVMSAHRTPARVAAFASGARDDGYGIVICGAGMAAHLAGAVAAQTTLPVIGVPLSGGALNGVDALYATVQMPRGIPVATVAVDGSANAALLAVEILAVADEGLAKRLADFRAEWTK